MERAEDRKRFREMSPQSLTEKTEEYEHELMNLRFRHSSGQLEKTSQFGAIRKRIARAKTIRAEKLRASRNAEIEQAVEAAENIEKGN